MNHNDEWAIPAQDIQTGDGTEEELNLEQITRTTTRRPMLVHQHEGTECLIPIALYTIPTTVFQRTPTAELLSMTTRPERITIVITVEDDKIDVCQTMMERYADSVEENDCVATVKMVADITERVLGVGDSGSGVMLKIGDFLKMLHPVQARSAGDAIVAAVERMRLDRLPKAPRHV